MLLIASRHRHRIVNINSLLRSQYFCSDLFNVELLSDYCLLTLSFNAYIAIYIIHLIYNFKWVFVTSISYDTHFHELDMKWTRNYNWSYRIHCVREYTGRSLYAVSMNVCVCVWIHSHYIWQKKNSIWTARCLGSG